MTRDPAAGDAARRGLTADDLVADDLVALGALVERYAALVDDRAFDALGALFTDDAVLRQPRPPKMLEPEDEVRGREAVVANFAQLTALHATQHAVVGRVFGADGDGATGRVAAVAHHVSGPEGKMVDHAWHLTYLDRYRRDEAGGWRIAERTLRLEWIEKRSVPVVRRR